MASIATERTLGQGGDIESYMTDLGRQARAAARVIAKASTAQKNSALLLMADAIEARRGPISVANELDLAAGKAKGLDDAMLDRLALTAARIDNMIEGLRQVAALPDPVGEINDMRFRPSGIQVGKMRVPLGVVGIIYESRPNVTCEAASLCLKSGNAVILRGGSEALHSNQAIAHCIEIGLTAAGIDPQAVQVVATTDRAAVGKLITMTQYVDVIIPRGGKSLIERIAAEARVPVLKHLDGICHVYIDDKADYQKAMDIAINAKTSRYGTCNTMETLLVAQGIAARILPALAKAFTDAGVELRACKQALPLMAGAIAATQSDWSTEYLAPILAVKIVADLDEAMDHIAEYSSAHTEAIVTEDYSRAQRFLREVDSSSVIVNASTRFADGFEYGLGAEIGISTDKLHARGPVGLEGLTSQKYIVFGDGQVRK